ncbi:hypothetical protein ACFO5R_07625 [Halosolutus amylolyticus]|uniref:Uncharacterized protein n=1 Tax=Halosolutus amylolyticus TaxID=2932267 RepID=A0ABD5PMQ3_9EURY
MAVRLGVARRSPIGVGSFVRGSRLETPTATVLGPGLRSDRRSEVIAP